MESREIRLRSRPQGAATVENFVLVNSVLPKLQDGEVLVRNTWMSVDPYMRTKMEVLPGGHDAFAAWPLGSTLDGRAVGRVVDSRSPKLAAGDIVFSKLGWRDYFIAKAELLTKLPETQYGEQVYLSVLGATGATAYLSLKHCAKLAPGKCIYVTGAAGAVGSLVCQIAKKSGVRVVASAGSTEKLRWLRDVIKVDAIVNYHDTNLSAAMSAACPDGIDIYYDNVGGEQLEIGLSLMRDYGDVILCGHIADYNDLEKAQGPRNFNEIRDRCLSVHGFLVVNHDAERAEFIEVMKDWISRDLIQWKDSVFYGLEEAPTALIKMMNGSTIGKTLVRLT